MRRNIWWSWWCWCSGWRMMMICCHCSSVCYCSPASSSMLICDHLWWQLCPCWWHFSPHSLFLLSLYLSVRLSVCVCVCLSLSLMVVLCTVINRAIRTSSIGLDVSPLLDGSCSLTTGSSTCAEEQLARSRNPQSNDFTKYASCCCCCFEICKIKNFRGKRKNPHSKYESDGS